MFPTYYTQFTYNPYPVFGYPFGGAFVAPTYAYPPAPYFAPAPAYVHVSYHAPAAPVRKMDYHRGAGQIDYHKFSSTSKPVVQAADPEVSVNPPASAKPSKAEAARLLEQAEAVLAGDPGEYPGFITPPAMNDLSDSTPEGVEADEPTPPAHSPSTSSSSNSSEQAASVSASSELRRTQSSPALLADQYDGEPEQVIHHIQDETTTVDGNESTASVDSDAGSVLRRTQSSPALLADQYDGEPEQVIYHIQDETSTVDGNESTASVDSDAGSVLRRTQSSPALLADQYDGEPDQVIHHIQDETSTVDGNESTASVTVLSNPDLPVDMTAPLFSDIPFVNSSGESSATPATQPRGSRAASPVNEFSGEIIIQPDTSSTASAHSEHGYQEVEFTERTAAPSTVADNPPAGSLAPISAAQVDATWAAVRRSIAVESVKSSHSNKTGSQEIQPGRHNSHPSSGVTEVVGSARAAAAASANAKAQVQTQVTRAPSVASSPSVAISEPNLSPWAAYHLARHLVATQPGNPALARVEQFRQDLARKMPVRDVTAPSGVKFGPNPDPVIGYEYAESPRGGFRPKG